MDEILTYFTRVTGFDFSELVLFFARFTAQDYPALLDLYTGREVQDRDRLSRAFRHLKELQIQVTSAKTLLHAHRSAFNSTGAWEGLELIEELAHTLQTIVNLGKWSRSSNVNGQYAAATTTVITLPQSQTLEEVQASLFGPDNVQNDWTKIALDNDLSEEQYRPEGGTDLTLHLPQNSLRLNSVVDYLHGDALYGRDFAQQLRFVNDDLYVLDPKQTIQQALTILLNLKRGDLPTSPTKGVDSRLYRGTNAGAIAFSSLFRQVYETFQLDDTFASVTLKSLTVVPDGLFIEVEIQTKLGELLTQNATL